MSTMIIHFYSTRYHFTDGFFFLIRGIRQIKTEIKLQNINTTSMHLHAIKSITEPLSESSHTLHESKHKKSHIE